MARPGNENRDEKGLSEKYQTQKMRSPLSTLPERDIHLWVAFPDEWAAPSQIAAARDILAPDEIVRMERFRFPEHRHLFAVSHLLVRTALSYYSDLPPCAWRFVNDENGKPRIDPVLETVSLTFSLAHTKGLAVVGVTRGTVIGVDVERTGRRVDAAGLSRRFFSPEEAAALENLPPDRLREQFPLYWTLKEAYIKALGLGFSHPLDSFAFRLTGERPHRIDFFAAEPQDPKKWRFALIEPRRPYVTALCTASLQDKPFTLRCYHASPSGGPAPLSIAQLGLSAGIVCAPL
jgi:4'-phosphopantetheinyl transferase